MMIPYEKLCEWAETVDPSTAPYIIKFVEEAGTKAKAEVKAAKEALHCYGYKVYEDQYHDVKEM